LNMKKQFTIFTVLFIMFISSFSIVLRIPAPVHATYVEGAIKKIQYGR
jgi:hypothetical protein